MGDLSPHFSTSEFVCKGRGRPGHRSHPPVVSDRLIAALERLRTSQGGRPLFIVSGHRCGFWNRLVGGAAASRHKLGDAADIPAGYVDEAGARAAGFTGVGVRGAWAVHVDVRPRAASWRY
jgi:uncharacterized protein YcbK (DUF882 family)